MPLKAGVSVGIGCPPVIYQVLSEETCGGCGRSLQRALEAEREGVTFLGGEVRGWKGVAIIARCRCGYVTIVALSADAPRAA